MSDAQLTRVADVFNGQNRAHANVFLRGLLNRAMMAGNAPRSEWLTLNPTFYPVQIDTLLRGSAPLLPADVLNSALHQSLALVAVAKARAAQPSEPPQSDALSRSNLCTLFGRVYEPLVPFCDSRQVDYLTKWLVKPLGDLGEKLDLLVKFNWVTGQVLRLELQPPLQ